jgi:chemotaxis protein methyltransferase CheR
VREPALLRRALGALLIGVTSLARDERVFAAFVGDVLPNLSERPGTLRVWSAGCASGAELHTVAILFAEAGLAGRSRFLGTDCRPEALQEAAAARYEEEALAPLSPEVRARNFERADDGWRLGAPLRDAIEWKKADVTRSAEQGPWDLVLCRNLAIYFSVSAGERVWSDLVRELRPGGYLMTGKAERPSHAGLTRRSPCLYRRTTKAET